MVKWAAWMVGIVALSICVAVIFPLLLPVGGKGVYFRVVAAKNPPFALSDAFVVAGTFVGFWCVGWAVSRRIDRWVDRGGRSPGAGIRVLITVVTSVAVVLICHAIPIHVSYASTVAVGCAIMTTTMIGKALRRDRMRRPTQGEYAALLAMAEEVGSDEEREQLLMDIKRCFVENANPDGSILRFHIDGYQRPPHHGQETFRGKDRFPVEGLMRDADGTAMDVALFVVHGRVYELELIKHTVGDVVAPDWTTFQVK
jgi:hypothetical protein